MSAGRNPIPFFGLGLISLISDDDILSFEDPEDLDGNGISGRANFISGRVGRLGLKAQARSIEDLFEGSDEPSWHYYQSPLCH